MTDPADSLSASVDSVTSTLLERARQKDRAAWERLVDLYYRLIFWWCQRRGVPSADIPDVGQEVLAAVARSLDTFRRDNPEDSFRAWLRGVTAHKIADYWRGRDQQADATGGSEFRANLENLPDSPDRLSQEIEFDASELEGQWGDAELEVRILYRQIVQFVRGRFSASDWYAFEQVTVAGRRPADVADELGVSTNKVYLAKSRIARAVRDEFQELM